MYSRQQKFARRRSSSQKVWLCLLTACGCSEDSRFENALPFMLAVVSFSPTFVRSAQDDRDRRKMSLCQLLCSASALGTVMGDGACMPRTRFRSTFCQTLLSRGRRRKPAKKNVTANTKGSTCTQCAVGRCSQSFQLALPCPATFCRRL